MEHIKQNDERLLEDIQKIGCFFRSCGIIAENHTNKNLTVEQINNGWKYAKEKGLIDKKNNVVTSAPIINYFLKELGDKGRFIEIGIFQNGKTFFYSSIRDTVYCHIDALIQKIKQNGKSKTHFRVVDKMGELIEDPHLPPIKVQGIYYSILYAYIKGK